MEEAARKVDRQIRDILAEMLEGGPDRSEECLAMAREAGLERIPDLVEEILIRVREQELESWNAEEEGSGAQEARERAREAAKKILELPQLTRVEAPKLQPSAGELPRRPLGPQPPQLNLDAPYDVAKMFVKGATVDKGGQRLYLFDRVVEGEPVRWVTLLHWQGQFYRWNGACYEEIASDDVRAQLYKFLSNASTLGGMKVLPRSRMVSEIFDGLEALTNVEGRTEVPAWVAKAMVRPEPRGLLACRNGLLEFETGRLWDHDPRFFGLNAVDFDYVAGARAERWEQFLGEVWPRDEETVATLQEFFGLWLTEVTKYHKAAMLIGRPRSGKGTIGRVLRGLLGKTAFVSVSLQSLGSDSFGMEPLIGKKLAMVPDVKVDGRANVTLIMERLLTTMGDDPISINRKNKKYWEGMLTIRWLVLGNDVPNFKGSDEAGALLSRIVTLATAARAREICSARKWSAAGQEAACLD